MPWIAFLFVLFVYLSFPTKNFYWDGIFFSQVIEDTPTLSASLLHPNHLFYNVFGYLAFQAAQIVGLQTRAVYVLQFVSSVFGAGCAVVVFIILRRATRSIYLCFALTLLFAFSATWWKFSTDADSYVPSVFFLLVGFYLLLPGKTARPFLVALAHSLAMFFHELAVLFFPAIVLGIILQTTLLERQKRIIAVLKYGFAAFFLTFGTYCLSFYLLTGTLSFKDFVRWIIWYSPENGFSPTVGENLLLALRGHLKLFVDGRTGFIDRNPVTVFLTILLVVLIVVFLIKIGRNLQTIKDVWQTALAERFYSRPVTLLCLTWIMPYLLFLFFFIPGNTFYRLFYFPALVFLFGMFLAPFENANRDFRHWRLALLAAVIALSNFLLFIRPNSVVRENTPLALALDANRLWSNKTVIYYDSLDTPARYVRYFNRSATWKFFDAAAPLEEFEKEVQNVYNNGGTVWLETSAVERLTAATPQTVKWLADNSSPEPKSELLLPAFKMKYVQIIPSSSSEQKSPF